MKKNIPDTGNDIQDWIISNKDTPPINIIKDLDFVSYPYDKYGKIQFSMEQCGGYVPLFDLSKDMHNGTYKGYTEVKDFAECLGKRMALALSFFKGKTNQEIEEILKEKTNG